MANRRRKRCRMSANRGLGMALERRTGGYRESQRRKSKRFAVSLDETRQQPTDSAMRTGMAASPNRFSAHLLQVCSPWLKQARTPANAPILLQGYRRFGSRRNGPRAGGRNEGTIAFIERGSGTLRGQSPSTLGVRPARMPQCARPSIIDTTEFCSGADVVTMRHRQGGSGGECHRSFAFFIPPAGRLP